jgi:hypothetical protein
VGDSVGEVSALVGGELVGALEDCLQDEELVRVALREDGLCVEAAKCRECREVQALVVAKRL